MRCAPCVPLFVTASHSCSARRPGAGRQTGPAWTEARGGPLGDELFGEDRLRRTLAGCVGMPAEAVVERVRMPAARWLGTGRHDDMAVMAITTPTPAR